MGFEFRVLKERRQWALSSVSGPPCFGLCSCFARFSKNHKTKKSLVRVMAYLPESLFRGSRQGLSLL